MASDCFGGYYNLPKFLLTDTNEHALIVPTNQAATPAGSSWTFPYTVSAFTSAGAIYPGFPSPANPVNSGLTLSFPNDVVGAMAVDGHPFKVKLAGVINNPGGGNATVKLYQVPAASIGVISATGSVTTAGAPGSNDNLLSTIAFTTPPDPSHFWLEYIFVWDSKTVRLDGYSIGQFNATAQAQAATTALTSNVANIAALSFMPSFTFASANANDAFTIQEFVLTRY